MFLETRTEYTDLLTTDVFGDSYRIYMDYSISVNNPGKEFQTSHIFPRENLVERCCVNHERPKRLLLLRAREFYLALYSAVGNRRAGSFGLTHLYSMYSTYRCRFWEELWRYDDLACPDGEVRCGCAALG
jgi:hypothetical protein